MRLINPNDHRPDGCNNRDPVPDGRVCEITPEMVAAGIDAFFKIDCVEDSPQEIVREIYHAMFRQAQAHPQAQARLRTLPLGQ